MSFVAARPDWRAAAVDVILRYPPRPREITTPFCWSIFPLQQRWTVLGGNGPTQTNIEAHDRIPP
jgi:hypothetical protein